MNELATSVLDGKCAEDPLLHSTRVMVNNTTSDLQKQIIENPACMSTQFKHIVLMKTFSFAQTEATT